MEGLVKKNGKVDVLKAFTYCAGTRAAKRLFDQYQFDMDQEGCASVQEVYDLIEDHFPNSSKAEELLDYLQPMEEEDIDSVEMTEDELKLKLTLLQSLGTVHQSIRHSDPSLANRITLIMNNQLRDVEQWCNSSQEAMDDPVWITDRLGDQKVSKETLFEIGNRASRLYYQKYHKYPIKVPRWINGSQKLVNKYTESTAPDTLDVAIEEVLEDE